MTEAVVGASLFGVFFFVAHGHSHEWFPCSHGVLSFRAAFRADLVLQCASAKEMVIYAAPNVFPEA